MNIYGLKNCSTCRKAVKDLTDAGHQVEMIDVRDTPLDMPTLARFHAALGSDLLNTRSTTWRELSEEARAGLPLNLLVEHPTLMKRPVIDTGSALHLGWTKDTQTALL